jgi:hypothetical protein
MRWLGPELGRWATGKIFKLQTVYSNVLLDKSHLKIRKSCAGAKRLLTVNGLSIQQKL